MMVFIQVGYLVIVIKLAGCLSIVFMHVLLHVPIHATAAKAVGAAAA
jgi:hypothetical protein